jgi:hypothetical protein
MTVFSVFNYVLLDNPAEIYLSKGLMTVFSVFNYVLLDNIYPRD